MKRSFHLRTACLASLCALLLLDAPSVSSAEADLIPRQVVLGTATPGGGFELFGQYLAEVINEVEPSAGAGGEGRGTLGCWDRLAGFREDRR